jgi:hypothetical protein
LIIFLKGQRKAHKIRQTNRQSQNLISNKKFDNQLSTGNEHPEPGSLLPGRPDDGSEGRFGLAIAVE